MRWLETQAARGRAGTGVLWGSRRGCRRAQAAARHAAHAARAMQAGARSAHALRPSCAAALCCGHACVEAQGRAHALRRAPRLLSQQLDRAGGQLRVGVLAQAQRARHAHDVLRAHALQRARRRRELAWAAHHLRRAGRPLASRRRAERCWAAPRNALHTPAGACSAACDEEARGGGGPRAAWPRSLLLGDRRGEVRSSGRASPPGARAWSRPDESRTSTKHTPPRLRCRCTQPHTASASPSRSGRSSPQAALRPSQLIRSPTSGRAGTSCGASSSTARAGVVVNRRERQCRQPAAPGWHRRTAAAEAARALGCGGRHDTCARCRRTRHCRRAARRPCRQAIRQMQPFTRGRACSSVTAAAFLQAAGRPQRRRLQRLCLMSLHSSLWHRGDQPDSFSRNLLEGACGRLPEQMPTARWAPAAPARPQANPDRLSWMKAGRHAHVQGSAAGKHGGRRLG